MPLIVRWPGIVKPGSQPTALVQNIDYAATFVDIAGGKTPTGLHGRSLVPVMRGATPADWRKSLYYHYYDAGHGVTKHYGVRTDRFTFVHFYPVDEWELYDNQKDPLQLHSVYAEPTYAATVTELKAELDRLRQRYERDFDPQAPEKTKKPKAAKEAVRGQADS